MDERKFSAPRDVVRSPLECSLFSGGSLPLRAASAIAHGVSAKRVKQVLKQTGLTVSRVSVLTSMYFGKTSPCFIPPTFLYQQRRGVLPRVGQVAALSQITGYRFSDWLRIFGFDLKLIPTLQLRIHTERTAVITPDHCASASHGSLIARDPIYQESDQYVFAKIGSQDAVVYPRIVPGSVVRANRHYSPAALNRNQRLLWLIEHPAGVSCCYIKPADDRHIILLPNRPPLSGWPLSLTTEARILGLVDLEFRPRTPSPVQPLCRAKRSVFLPALNRCARDDLSNLLRRARARSGLTLREAHEMTVKIARLLGNREYAIALSLLSDYEATNKLPRHVPKIMTLCILYGLHFIEVARAGGIWIDDSDKLPLAADEEELYLDARGESKDLSEFEFQQEL